MDRCRLPQSGNARAADFKERSDAPLQCNFTHQPCIQEVQHCILKNNVGIEKMYAYCLI